MPAGLRRREGNGAHKPLEIRSRYVKTGEAIPFGARCNGVVSAEPLHLLFGHQTWVIVLVAGNRQSEALDRVGDKTGRLVPGKAMKGVEYGWQIVTGEVG